MHHMNHSEFTLNIIHTTLYLQVLRTQSSRLDRFPDMPQPPPAARDHMILDEHPKDNRDTLQQRVDDPMTGVTGLNECQRPVYDAIMAAIQDDINNVEDIRSFFLDSPGGCGKTHTTNLLLSAVRAQVRHMSTNKVVISR